MLNPFLSQKKPLFHFLGLYTLASYTKVWPGKIHSLDNTNKDGLRQTQSAFKNELKNQHTPSSWFLRES